MTKDIGVDANIDRVRVKEMTSPSTPPSGYGYIYAKTDGLYFKGDGGTEIGPLAAATAGLTMDDVDPYGNLHRLDTADADDDEFDDGSIDGAWTQVDPTGAVTWVENHHTLSAVFNGQSVNDLGVMLKASTLADGEAYETLFRNVSLKNGSFIMGGGLVVTDGTTATSNAMAAMYYIDIVAACYDIELWKGTLTNLNTGGTTRQYLSYGSSGALKIRLLRNSSTSFSCLYSTQDGGQFNAFGASIMNPAFTPTHAGLLVSAWGTSSIGLSSYDYFRVVA